MSLPRMLCSWSIATMVLVSSVLISQSRAEDKVQPPISERFAGENVEEVPDFQRHISPLLGRLGCNSRSCHGSFQGQGGFRLSLFGYDFAADHKELLAGKEPRVNLEDIDASLILNKPTDEDNHEGGKRYEKGKWEHHTLRRWIEAGGKYDAKAEPHKLVRLEVTPAELWFKSSGETVPLKAVAVWADGLREDVTPLCRFQSNSEQIANVDATGVVKANEPGDSHVVVFYDNAVVPVPVIRPVSDLAGDKYPRVETPTKIDALVVEKLKKLGITPSELAADHEFLRRLCLDLTGSLPSAAEVEAFLADPSPNKRAEKIEELLKSPAYAAWWTTKLCDFTGNNDQQVLNTSGNRGPQDWYDWIYKRVAENQGYDKIAEGIVLAVSRRPGQSYLEYCEEMSKLYQGKSEEKYADRPSLSYYWHRRNLRTSEERAISFAYTFLGIRIQCAQCHKHPFDQWSKEDFEQFKGFFAGVTLSQANRQSNKEEYEQILKDLGLDPKAKGNIDQQLSAKLKEGKTIPFAEVFVTAAKKDEKGRNNSRVPTSARLLGEEKTDLTEFEDARKPLMDWLREKDNPYFARAFVNRVWANYFNVGIVQPPDDLSLANPPSNKPLLDYLTAGFVEHNFDMHWLHREICNSRTYQTSWKPNETNSKDERNFSRSVPRRLPAEAAYDACLAATSDDARAAEFRTNLKDRAISVPGASARNNNGKSTFALQVFGRSIRESNCDCDRSSEASLLQTVYLQNDASVLGMVNGGKGTWVDQVSREWTKTGTSADRDLPEGLNVAKEIKRTEARLAQAKKDKKADKEQIERLENRLAALELASGKESAPEKKPEATKTPEEDQASVIRQAYLRTLSRPPTEDEVARCREFLATASTPLDGVRGLLWALINTKEFIVNH